MNKKIVLILSIISAFSLMGCSRNTTAPTTEKEDVAIQKPVVENSKEEKEEVVDNEKYKNEKEDKDSVFQKPTKEQARASTYDNTMSIVLPENAKEIDMDDSEFYYLIGTDCSLNLVREYAYGYTLDDYMKVSVPNAIEDLGLSNYKTYNKKFNGVDGAVFEWDWEEKGLRGYQYTFFHDNEAYVLTFGCLKESYSEFLPQIEEILSTLELK